MTALISEHLTNEPIGMPDPPVIVVVAAVLFVLGANACYTGGWIGELIVGAPGRINQSSSAR